MTSWPARLHALLPVVLVAQAIVLVFMAGEREYIRAYGERVYLQSAPIDPRDPFRGDFVRLSYPANTLHRSLYRGERAFESLSRGEKIYVSLDHVYDDVYKVSGASDTPPASGVYLRGRITQDYRLNQAVRQFVSVSYGIEQYFVEQGRGRDIEKRLGRRDTMQVPAEMELAVSGGGIAVLTGYRWSPLGIQLSLTRTVPARQPDDPVVSPVVQVTLTNVSEAPLRINDPGDHCAFRLTREGQQDYEPGADPGCPDVSVPNVIVLAPGDDYTAVMDFALPRWHVLEDGERKETGALQRWEQYRLHFQSLPADDTWQGELSTPRFNAGGRID